MKVLTSVVNNPVFIEIQYHTLKKHLDCNYEFIVFNDAKPFPDFTNGGDKYLFNQIFNVCRNLGIKCIQVPNLHQQNMDCPVVRCSEAMNFMYEYMLQNKDEYLIIDSDMFPIDSINIDKYREYDCAVVLQQRDYVKPFQYIWNGLFYFNMNSMNDVESIRWDKCLNSDVGGMTNEWLTNRCNKLPTVYSIRNGELDKYHSNGIYFIRHLWSLTWDDSEMPENLKNDELIKFIREDPRNSLGSYFCEIYDNTFLHYRAGGDWQRKGLEFHNELTNRLKNILLK
jgi:hypothetical protein